MTQKHVLLIACILGALSVALGAFAAHGLKKMVDAYYLEIFEKGVKYQFYHTFAILAIGILINQFSNINFNLPVYLFLAGIFFFSGSLYVMTFIQPKWLGPITPIGGLCFIAGWLTMAWKVYQSK
ncbi:MAG: hypothetical protein RL708_1514 [Bacteroidota bacterium]|jgi:uncharacterized membrane protein YgdD (TMEM256/DUF423 family)